MRRHMTKKRDHRTLDLVSREAQVRVRHDVARRSKHGANSTVVALALQTNPG
jgi:hypothetical protein